MATDNFGDILTTTNPTGGPSAWQTTNVGVEALFEPTCPSSSLCVVADSEGDVLTSTEPTGSASAWHKVEHLAVNSGSTAGFVGISCPTTSLCLMVEGGSGNIFTSTEPTGGASAWQRTELNKVATAASCVTASFCVLGDLTNPEEIAVVGDGGNGILTATSPTGGASSWTSTSLNTDGNNRPSAVACPASQLCVVGDRSGHIVTSTKPAAGANAWTVSHLEVFTPIYALSCPSTALCVAINEGADVLTSTDPGGGAGAWKITSEYPTIPLGVHSLACPATNLCVAVGEAAVVTSTHPLVPGTWQTSQVESFSKATERLTAVSCPTTALCVATDNKGNVLTATSPTGGVPAWSIAHVDSMVGTFGQEGELVDVSCAATTFCVANDTSGHIFSSTDPTGGASAWHAVFTNTNGNIGDIACLSAQLCVGAGYTNGGGSECKDATITEGGTSWTLTPDCGYSGGAIACPSTTLCVALDEEGSIIVGTSGEGAEEKPSEGGKPPAEGGESPPPGGSTSSSAAPSGSGTPTAKNPGRPGTTTPTKHLTTAQKLAKALKQCKRDKPARKRKACEARAKKRYKVKKTQKRRK
jgi:hypothetical protein